MDSPSRESIQIVSHVRSAAGCQHPDNIAPADAFSVDKFYPNTSSPGCQPAGWSVQAPFHRRPDAQQPVLVSGRHSSPYTFYQHLNTDDGKYQPHKSGDDLYAILPQDPGKPFTSDEGQESDNTHGAKGCQHA